VGYLCFSNRTSFSGDFLYKTSSLLVLVAFFIYFLLIYLFFIDIFIDQDYFFLFLRFYDFVMWKKIEIIKSNENVQN